ncbi:polymer-forming cytoskeletal protein [Leptospira bourretii]|uniref:Polymer-forming cytoskeletal protein n=10 Tax=Leptospira TaxID=171 RepID=A0A4V3JL80_9LEPT|nr:MULTISPECIES: polymer-forming cytoskeletal protein [Leptospira]PKA26076.1 cell division protein [Leptospira sp. mixed culture ATI2-C-A1]EKJ85472.1 Polymer-forming cytoskeletal [Leptospira meyeri serovar Hardjo str. Went 5]EMJ86787.1 polymer-forming cytoskeletal family protein [Leptospira meyeri serovar Semaranga str. Veldrot Semarang 173]EMY61427.1 polymer-forming cytoskeletal family protein [Leptospira terpstrae serovar Hualin str. LT 11-33 = ATCC 700639]MBM9546655.1 polymer-forming cytosk
MAIGKDSINSVIGPGSIFEGKFYIAGSLRIDGKFEGDIKTEDALVIGETGKVKTNISAREVIVSGTLIGNIKAENEVKLEGTGRMLGDITAPYLELQKGVVAKGNITITGGQKKDVRKIVEESFGGIKSLDTKD